MIENVKYHRNNWNEKNAVACEKVKQAIADLKLEKKSVNFSSVSRVSGVSKQFLHGNEEIKKLIELERSKNHSENSTLQNCGDTTPVSNDIEKDYKDKDIAELKAEVNELYNEIRQLKDEMESHE